MKIKLSDILKSDNELISNLLKHNIEVDDESKYELTLNQKESKNTIIAKTDNDDFKIINIKEILYFESFNNNVYAVLKNQRLKLKDKLYTYDKMYCSKGFIRVSKSYIVNIKEIDKIKTTFNRKFILLMNNKEEIDVNRSYYEDFKERIGL